ncbi:ABC-2 transporter permease [Lacticaseibacillus parakribbianus]|uniref:ABC-2 transporter permease n=1 Tax=Lacticaseibacillus parakribbianus TaxID=2970927 RepID=UPI0021CB8781|nr:ABC-2 transporter permease [Lacticaseibacillus parakribbianus]
MKTVLKISWQSMGMGWSGWLLWLAMFLLALTNQPTFAAMSGGIFGGTAIIAFMPLIVNGQRGVKALLALFPLTRRTVVAGLYAFGLLCGAACVLMQAALQGLGQLCFDDPIVAGKAVGVVIWLMATFWLLLIGLGLPAVIRLGSRWPVAGLFVPIGLIFVLGFCLLLVVQMAGTWLMGLTTLGAAVLCGASFPLSVRWYQRLHL